MTLIELFDRTPVENIITSLALKPEKVIFIGSESRKIKRAVCLYQQIFDRRGLKIEIEVRSVAKNDLEAITDMLYDILEEDSTEEQFVVDISGGDESTLVAVGMILGDIRGRSVNSGNCSEKCKKLYAFRINVVSRRGTLFEIIPSDGGRIKIERRIYDFSYNTQVYLTVEENIILHGGRIISKGVNFRRGDSVAEDVETMWNICRRDCTAWNAKIGRLSGAVSSYSDTSKLFMIPELAFGEGKTDVDRNMWDEFVGSGLVKIDEKRTTDGIIVFTYKNKIVEECLNKAGSSLEYLTYKAGIEEMYDGEPVFNDAELSVVIDWDDEPNGTSNEIDCIFMCGLVPVFVSCKNGDVKTDELYKLEAVSEKFGGGYAKTALVSTVYFDPESRSYDGIRATETLKNRADDMQIRMLMKVHNMTSDRLGTDLAKLV